VPTERASTHAAVAGLPVHSRTSRPVADRVVIQENSMSILSVLPLPSAAAYPHRAVIADLEEDFVRMVDKAIGAILAGDPKPDTVFGAFAPFIAMARSVSYHEGKLLEAGIIRIAACNPDLMVMPQDRPMPIVPAALAFLERNDWSSLEGIRLRSDVHYRTTYTPDLIVVNRKHHSALIMDITRSLASYQERRLNALRNRMMAAALIGADWLYVECKAPPASDVGIAIVDGADEASDPDRGTFGLAGIGDLLEVAGAGEALAHLRSMFAVRVRAELERQCREALARTEEVRRPEHAGADCGKACPDDAGSGEGGAVDPVVIGFDSSGTARPAQLTARVRVGFARSRAGP
jgi:hypothetical protein